MRPALSALLALLFLSPGLSAASFDISATADKTKVELGETFQVTVRLTEQGRHAFPPRPLPVEFKDFDARQAGQNTFTSIVNGDFTTETVWVVELSPKRSGRLLVPALAATAKDPLTGEVTKGTQPIPITVVRPSGTGLGLGLGQRPWSPSQSGPLPSPEPTPEIDPVTELMPDRGLPWARLGLALGSFSALLGLLAWLALRRPVQALAEPAPRDPGQQALERLERAKEQALLNGDAGAFMKDLSGIVRTYLRHRLSLRQEATLAEALAAARLKDPEVLALGQRLELVLYGDSPAEPADIQEGYQKARVLVAGLELRNWDLEAAAVLKADRAPKRRKKRGD